MLPNFLAQLKSTTKVLRPTATVVRSRGGNITVERADLLSETQHTDCVASAKSAQRLAQQVKISATSTGYLWRYLNEKHHTRHSTNDQCLQVELRLWEVPTRETHVKMKPD